MGYVATQRRFIYYHSKNVPRRKETPISSEYTHLEVLFYGVVIPAQTRIELYYLNIYLFCIYKYIYYTHVYCVYVYL